VQPPTLNKASSSFSPFDYASQQIQRSDSYENNSYNLFSNVPHFNSGSH
jgi:hypothetical protein